MSDTMPTQREALPQEEVERIQRNQDRYYGRSRDRRADIVLTEARERGARIL